MSKSRSKARRDRRRLLDHAYERQAQPQFTPPTSWIDDRTPHYLYDLGLTWQPFPSRLSEHTLPDVIRTRSREGGSLT